MENKKSRKIKFLPHAQRSENVNLPSQHSSIFLGEQCSLKSYLNLPEIFTNGYFIFENTYWCILLTIRAFIPPHSMPYKGKAVAVRPGGRFKCSQLLRRQPSKNSPYFMSYCF